MSTPSLSDALRSASPLRSAPEHRQPELLERDADQALDLITFNGDMDLPLQVGVFVDQGVQVVAGQYQ